MGSCQSNIRVNTEGYPIDSSGNPMVLVYDKPDLFEKLTSEIGRPSDSKGRIRVEWVSRDNLIGRIKVPLDEYRSPHRVINGNRLP